jgi:hydrogenase expression/formation protein HypD
VVHEEGNPAALALMAEVFALRPHFEWCGLGFISQSALRLRDELVDFDAEAVRIARSEGGRPEGLPVW